MLQLTWCPEHCEYNSTSVWSWQHDFIDGIMKLTLTALIMHLESCLSLLLSVELQGKEQLAQAPIR